MSADDVAAVSGFPGKMSFASGNVSAQWRVFKRQLTYFLDSKFTVGQMTSKRMMGVLMTALGREGIDIYDTMYAATDAPTFEEVLASFDKYCSPKKNSVFERSIYFRLVQKPDQTIDMFVLELKRQAALCEFAKEEQDNLLRDILVIGIRDAKLREELLRDADLNFEKAVQACRTRERSQTEAALIAGPAETAVAVDRLAQRQPSYSRYSRPPPTPAPSSATHPCPNCFYLHGTLRPCPAINATCKKCGQPGHFIKVCRKQNTSAPSGSSRAVRAVEQQPQAENDSNQVDLLRIYNCTASLASGSAPQPAERAWFVDLPILNAVIKLKLDTAAECNTLSEYDYKRLSPRPLLQRSRQIIKPYLAPPFSPLGKIIVQYKAVSLEFLVVPGREENLLGFTACRQLNLIQRVSRLSMSLTREAFLKINAASFQGLGKIPGLTKIHTDPAVQPKVARWRRFAYSLTDKLKDTLKDMAKQDIIVAVTVPTDWVSNITVVEKKDGTLRICLDPQNLNQAIRVPKYQIPKTDDILVKLTHKSYFTVMDLKPGFWQLELDEESSFLTTFNSPLGRFRFKRLCFGINCAPEIFMAKMISIFGDIPQVFPYFDDLIIATETDKEHDEVLRLVCARAQEYNVKFNAEKLQFKQPSVQFLGLIISAEGVRPAPKHVRAMAEMPTPADTPAVQRFLGLVKFLAQFIPNVSKLTSNLRQLTHKDAEFNWTPACESEFCTLKQALISEPVLVYFDISKPILVQTDSSKDGLGAVLLQEDKPVAFASCALTLTETKYSQIEKELLAIVFALEQFNDYVYGLPVLVHSDHRPLEAIMKKDLDKVSPRLQRLRLRLLRYKVTVRYKPGKEMLIADALSRAYLPDEEPDLEYQSVTVHSVKSLAVTPEKAREIAQATKEDPVLATVHRWLDTNDWPEASQQQPTHLARFIALRPSLSLADGIIFYENRLVVPASMCNLCLQRLHEGHLGIEKTKRLARETLYWAGMSTDITQFVQSCPVCQKFAPNVQKDTLQQYPLPTYPWQQLAIDIASLNNKEFLVVVDKFSNWPEVLPIASKSAAEIIAHLTRLFAHYGIPESIVSDNNPFNSAQYLKFATEWGFRAIFTSPHYAQANGHAERTVQTAKNILRKCHEDGTSFQYAILQYRNTPLADTGFSPAQILMGRRLRTKLPVASQLLVPQQVPQDAIRASKEHNCAVQKYYYDRDAAEPPVIGPAAPVWVKDNLAESAWQPAVVQQEGPGPRSFVVQKEGNKGTVVRNRRFLRPRNTLVRPARFCDSLRERKEGVESGNTAVLDNISSSRTKFV